MPKLKIIGWRYGLQKVTMTKTLQEHLSLRLSEAKNCTDEVLDGKIVSFEMEDLEAAKKLAAILEDIGTVVELETE